MRIFILFRVYHLEGNDPEIIELFVPVTVAESVCKGGVALNKFNEIDRGWYISFFGFGSFEVNCKCLGILSFFV